MQKWAPPKFAVLYRKALSLLLVFVLLAGIFPTLAFADNTTALTITTAGVTGDSVATLSRTVQAASGSPTIPSTKASTVYVATVNSADETTLKNSTGVKLTASYNCFLTTTAKRLSLNNNGEKTVNALNTSCLGFEVAKSDLTAAGFQTSDLNSSASHYYYAHFDFSKKSGSVFGLLIQVVQTKTVDKASLKAKLDAVPQTGYYTENDRFNGSDVSKTSFWAEMQAVVATAQAVYDNADAAQSAVNAAAKSLDQDNPNSELSKAISKLIPTSQINATALYERTQQDLRWHSPSTETPSTAVLAAASDSRDAVAESNTTSTSWQTYQAALTEAQNLLNRLFDEDGKPTDANSSADTELVQQVNAAADALDPTAEGSAVAGLEKRIESSGLMNKLPDAQSKYDLLKTLVQRYDPESKGLSKSDYTADSWSALQAARDSARTAANISRPTADTSEREYLALRQAYKSLRNAWDQLTESKDSITVTVTVVDNAAARSRGSWLSQTGTHTLTLGKSRTLADVVQQLGIQHSEWVGSSGNYEGVVSEVFRQDILMDAPLGGSFGQNTSYNSIVMRDGDRITLARLDQPIKPMSSGVGNEAKLSNSERLEAIRSTTLTGDAEIKQGVSGRYTAVSMAAFEGSYTGRTSPLSEATVFVSPAAAQTAAETQAATVKTTLVTDENGSFSYAFYAPGYYYLSVYPLGENKDGSYPGLTASATILVHVTETSAGEQTEIRAALQKELDDCYGKYPESYFTAEAWEQLNAAYNTGKTGIAESESLVGSKDALDTALAKIKSLQETATKENKSKLDMLFYYMDKLPDDASRVSKDDAETLQNLIEQYESLTVYQKEQLTRDQQKKYDALAKAYGEDGSTLPEHKAYAVSLELKADSEADLQVLQKLFQEARTLIPDSCSTAGTVFWYDDEGQTYQVTEAVPNDSFVYMDGWHKITQLGSKASFQKLADAVPGFSFEQGNRNDVWYFYINGTRYELKSVTMNGEAIEQTGIGSFLQMPYEDAKIVATYGAVDSSNPPDALDAARKAAKAAVTAKFNDYAEDDYSADNWKTLKAAYEAAVNEGGSIDQAATTEAISAAQSAAIRAMAAVKTKAQESDNSGSSGGDSNKPLPNYGKVVGRVHIVVENQTFTSAASDGSPPAWYGTLIDNWYDLCEKDTMMSSVLKALQLKGCNWSTGSQGSADSWDDYGITYIASIKAPANVKADGSFHVNDADQRLGEFSGESGSGWMGTLNDWFTNYGFANFSYENGQLEDGDEIHIMFTQNLGLDIGGTWGNSDTSLKDLSIQGSGKLYPNFSSDVTNYAYIISGNSDNLTVTPTAANKNYQVRTYLNEYNKDSAFFKRTHKVPVSAGDTVYVGCGEYSWPSMNNQETEARPYSGTKYTISIYNSLGEYVKASIDNLPASSSISLANYKDYASQVTEVRNLYDSLSAAEKSKVTNSDKLSDVEAAVKKFQEIDKVKSMLAALPNSDKATDAQVRAAKNDIEATDKAYKALSDEQKGYITIGDYKNYNALVERLSKLTHTSAGTISKNPNEEAASEVIGLISAIGTVTKDSGSKIQAARSAYDKLTDAQKKLVSNYKVLTEAEAAFAKLSTGLAFTDVKEGDYFYNAVKWAVEKSITNGTSATTFGPEEGCTRSQMVTFLWRAAGSPEPTGKTNPFTDVTEDAYYYKALLWAIENGITKGTTDTTFSPDETCTRGQMATFLYRNAKSPAVTGSSAFTDVSSSDYYSDAVTWAFQQGITKGATDTTYEPEASCTRGQMVTFLYRYLGK